MIDETTVGVAVYHSIDLADEIDRVGELQRIVEGMLETGNLAFFEGRIRKTDRFSRQKRATEASIRQMLVDIRGGEFAEVTFADRTRTEQEQSATYASFHFTLAPATNPRVGATDTPRNPYRVYVLIPRTQVAEGRFRESVHHLVGVLKAPYAFIHLGSRFRDALMEVTSVPMFGWSQSLTAREARQKARLSQCQVERVRIGEVVTGAYWGNYWGPEITERLGGPERVLAEAPVDVIEYQSNNTLYAQLTSELPRQQDQQYLSALDQLGEYLLPVAVMSK